MATKWALESFDPLFMSWSRFLACAVLSIIILMLRKKTRDQISIKDLSSAFVPGVMFGINVVLWTYGLKYTSVANSSFISSLYIVILPIAGWLFYRNKITPVFLLYAFVAIFGSILISEAHKVHVINTGDLLAFGCAITMALQILSLEYWAPKVKSPFGFNAGQAFWSGAVCLVCSFFTPAAPFTKEVVSTKAIVGILFLLFGTNMIANYLQVKAQAKISSSTAGLIFLLESPFATVLAFFILAEPLSNIQAAGAILILIAAYKATTESELA